MWDRRKKEVSTRDIKIGGKCQLKKKTDGKRGT